MLFTARVLDARQQLATVGAIFEMWGMRCACPAQVVDVDLGSNVPTITNLRALPCPADALWPQVVFDLDYPGA